MRERTLLRYATPTPASPPPKTNYNADRAEVVSKKVVGTGYIPMPTERTLTSNEALFLEDERRADEETRSYGEYNSYTFDFSMISFPESELWIYSSGD